MAAYDVVVLGAGIVGASLAVTLARDGRRVLLLERDLAEPDTFRGELLQPGGLRKLHELGLGECLDGIDAQPCYGYVVYRPDLSATGGPTTEDHVPIPYPKWAPDSEKPACGRSFHHGRLIMKLRAAVAQQPNITCEEGTVTDLIEDGDAIAGVVYKPKEGAAEAKRVQAHMTFDCTGSFSKFRKRLTTSKPSYTSHFVALLLHNLTLPYPAHGYVILANPAPVLCYQIGTNDTRVLVNVPDPIPSVSSGALKQYLLEQILPQLPCFMVESFKVAAEERLRSVPCQTMPTTAVRRPGGLCVGDALNMRHPLTGGGMTVGLTDVELLTRLLRKLPDLSHQREVLKAVQPFYDARRNVASTINILAQALFDVFCGGSKVPAMAPVQKACFAYFPHYGTPCLGLVSGLNPSPVHLIGHFFTVAAFAMYQLLCPIPWPSKIKEALLAFWASFLIIRPLIVQDLLMRNNVEYREPFVDE